MYLLDTNTLIYFFKGTGNVAPNLLAKPPKEIELSSISLYELEVGLAKSERPKRRRHQLSTLMTHLHVVPIGEREAKASAQLRAKLERSGQPIGPLDNLIAGTALCHGATLVTHNTAEFARVPGLNLEDWF